MPGKGQGLKAMKKKKLQATKGTAWRNKARRTYAAPLPSGFVALLRPVSIEAMVSQGELPDILSTLAAQQLFKDMDFEEIAEEGTTSKAYIDLINLIVPAAFASPKVVEDPSGPDEIALSDIGWPDKVIVFQLALLPVDALEKFCDGQAADVEDVSNGDDPEPTTE